MNKETKTSEIKTSDELIHTIKTRVDANQIQKLLEEKNFGYNQKQKNDFFNILMEEIINHPLDKHLFISSVFTNRFGFRSDYFYKKTIKLATEHSQEKLNYVLKYFFNDSLIVAYFRANQPQEYNFYTLDHTLSLSRVKDFLDNDFEHINKSYRYFLIANFCEKLIEKKQDKTIIFLLNNLLSNDNSKSYIDNQNTVNSLLVQACEHNNIEVVKYLLTSKNLTYHADIHYDNDIVLKLACQNGKLDIVSYLLTSEDLTEHADIYNDNCSAFKKAYNHKHMQLVNYLVYDYQLKKTQPIMDFFNRKFEGLDIDELQNLRKTFEQREIYIKLNNNLIQNDNVIVKRIKI